MIVDVVKNKSSHSLSCISDYIFRNSIMEAVYYLYILNVFHCFVDAKNNFIDLRKVNASIVKFTDCESLIFSAE
jgi:hypothetical protein